MCRRQRLRPKAWITSSAWLSRCVDWSYPGQITTRTDLKLRLYPREHEVICIRHDVHKCTLYLALDMSSLCDAMREQLHSPRKHYPFSHANQVTTAEPEMLHGSSKRPRCNAANGHLHLSYACCKSSCLSFTDVSLRDCNLTSVAIVPHQCPPCPPSYSALSAPQAPQGACRL